MEWRDINLRISDWIKWAGVRVIILTPAVVLETGYHLSSLTTRIFDTARKSYYKLVEVYDLIPYQGVPNAIIEAKVQPVLDAPKIEPLTDVVVAIEGKQVIIVGESGAGKSTLAQYIASIVGGRVRVYEPEGTPTDWRGLEVIGRGENYSAIDEAMQDDLDDLTARIQIRNEKGDAGLAGMELITIAEELPELIEKVPTAGEWLERHLRRGRKSKRFVIGLSQEDTVAALGLEGKGGLRKAFCYIRLGKIAIEHAKRLKRPELVEWLKSNPNTVTKDDDPLLLPPYREMVASAQRLSPNYTLATPETSSKTLEATAESAFEPISQEIPPTIGGILAAIEAGKSDDWITKHILKTPGGETYKRNKSMVSAVRSALSAECDRTNI